MVKYTFLFYLALLLFFSCEKKYTETQEDQITTEEIITTENASNNDSYYDAKNQNEAVQSNVRALELLRSNAPKDNQLIYNELLREPKPKHYYRERSNESQECEFCGEQDECGEDCECEGSCNLDDCSCQDRAEAERESDSYEEEEE